MENTKFALETNRISNEPAVSPLRLLRQNKGISLRLLAHKIGLEKSRLGRLERKPIEDLSLAELKLLTTGLDISFHRIFTWIGEAAGLQAFHRASLKKPAYILDFGEGAKITAHLSKTPRIFVGTLTLSPQKGIAADRTPKSEFLYYLILKGTLHVKTIAGESIFNEEDYYAAEQHFAYELFNPHQFKEVSALVVSLPSFL